MLPLQRLFRSMNGINEHLVAAIMAIPQVNRVCFLCSCEFVVQTKDTTILWKNKKLWGSISSDT
jgi:hypothetical protein